MQDFERPTVNRDASGADVMGGLLVGAISGVVVWALIAFVISVLF